MPPVEPSAPPASSKTAVHAPIAGKMAYAVRMDGRGVVFDVFADARKLYHDLQAQGHSVALAAGPSLTDGVSFVENFAVDGSSSEARRRREWIVEEFGARGRRLSETWRAMAVSVDSWAEIESGGSGPEESDVSSDSGW